MARAAPTGTVEAVLSLLDSADLLGRCRYVELAAFSLLGRRAPGCEGPAVVAYLAGASLAHGWRAGQLEALLPVSTGLPGAAELTRSPAASTDLALELATAPGGDAELLDALLGAIYPSMSAGYAERLSAASPAADPPVARTLRRLLADLEELRREGELVARGLPVPEPRRRRAVEDALAQAGGLFGPLAPGEGAERASGVSGPASRSPGRMPGGGRAGPGD